MRTPPLLLGATLLFWGGLTGHLFIAAAIALALEGSRVVKLRWDFSTADFNRISDLCVVILLGTLVYLLISDRSFQIIIIIFRWLPVILLPLVIANVYSTSDKIDISALFMVVRKKLHDQGKGSGVRVNLTYLYFGTSILAASAANVRTPAFYAGLLVVSAWGLWAARSSRFSPVLWICFLTAAALGGYTGQKGLHGLQIFLENKGLQWVSALNPGDADPYRGQTAIGDIGTLKLSDQILLRVKAPSDIAYPILLRQTSYNIYQASMWFAARSGFSEIEPDVDGKTWNILSAPQESRSMDVTAYLKRGKAMLSLPGGTFQISEIPAARMQRNRFGAVKVEDGPGMVTYRAKFSRDTSLDGPPDKADLSIPPKERTAIYRTVKALQLDSKSPPDILKQLMAFLQNNFNYSLVLDREDTGITPLADFLLRTRSGHCEYFATATVLLLRAAGIPARYASGFSVQEFSRFEKRFVVRARHAHSWALVYLDGVWQDFDTTPPSWMAIEEENASFLQPLADIWSLAVLQLSRWRWQEGNTARTWLVVLLIVPLIIIFARRLFTAKKVKRVQIDRDQKPVKKIYIGQDSDFYRIEKKLNELGYDRFPFETYSSWIKRIEASRPESVSLDRLNALLALHYKYRFDPAGATPAEKAELKSGVEYWLQAHNQQNQIKASEKAALNS